MKKILYIFVLVPFIANAQPPAGYYNGILGQDGQALYHALYNKITSHAALSYTPGLWNAYYTTDVKSNGKLWDIYSDKPGGTPNYQYTMGTNQCSGSSPSAEGGCYNREHTWPQSKFGSQAPMYTDLWIVYPTDYFVNSKRADLPYGKVGSTVTNNFTNGTKIGNNVYAGAPSGNCFEPIDSFKGDIARTYFYIVTCYLADSNKFSDWEMSNKITLKPWAIQMLLEWHHNDPVSAKEIARNEAAALLQNNRNPFIDYPIFADCIWGGASCTSLSTVAIANIENSVSVYPNPATNVLHADWTRLNHDQVKSVQVMNVQGQLVYQQENEGQNTKADIDLSNWAKGIYSLQLKTNQAVIVKKIVVQ